MQFIKDHTLGVANGSKRLDKGVLKGAWDAFLLLKIGRYQ